MKPLVARGRPRKEGKLMKRIFCSLLTMALIGVGVVAQAIDPGCYFARSYHEADKFNAVDGAIEVRRLEPENGLPQIELFCISTGAGERAGDGYAGIINHHGPARALGTVMYKLSTQERSDLLKGKFVKGTWLMGVNATLNNVRLNTITDTRIDCTPNDNESFPIPVILPQEYRFLDGKIGEVDLAMRIVALAKFRVLNGESMNLRAQSYKLEITGYDTDIFTVVENGVTKKYSISNNLMYIHEMHDDGTSRVLCSANPEQGPFGNAICTGDDVLVRSDSSRAGRIVEVLNKGDVVKCYYFQEGEAVGDANQWAYVILKNGQAGYVFQKYIQYIENR